MLIAVHRVHVDLDASDLEGVFNQGIAFSVIFLSITLITGIGGHLSLAKPTLAGICVFTAGQLARHFGLSLLVGGIVGAGLAAAVAVILGACLPPPEGPGPDLDDHSPWHSCSTRPCSRCAP